LSGRSTRGRQGREWEEVGRGGERKREGPRRGRQVSGPAGGRGLPSRFTGKNKNQGGGLNSVNMGGLVENLAHPDTHEAKNAWLAPEVGGLSLAGAKSNCRVSSSHVGKGREMDGVWAGAWRDLEKLRWSCSLKGKRRSGAGNFQISLREGRAQGPFFRKGRRESWGRVFQRLGYRPARKRGHAGGENGFSSGLVRKTTSAGSTTARGGI